MERRMVRLRGMDVDAMDSSGLIAVKNLAFPCAWYREPEAPQVVLTGPMLGCDYIWELCD